MIRAFVSISSFHLSPASHLALRCPHINPRNAVMRSFWVASSTAHWRIGRRVVLALAVIPILGIIWSVQTSADGGKVVKSEEEWMKILGPERFEVMRKGGTEWSFTSELNKEKRKGVYRCAACGNLLYESEARYESGTGWPSFWRPVDNGVIYRESLMDRIVGQKEVLCARCESHLGHVFRDGPPPTGQRYCMNGIALSFEPFSK